jgi:hypothetical protein
MRSLILAFAACLAACTEAHATRIGGPDGAPVFDVLCTDKQDACLAKAAQLCPDGYETTDSDGYIRQVYVRGVARPQFHGYLQVRCAAARTHAE